METDIQKVKGKYTYQINLTIDDQNVIIVSEKRYNNKKELYEDMNKVSRVLRDNCIITD
jgi:hypothetical protein